MEVFLSNITSFPIIVYTFLMAIIICYWLLAVLGAVDIEMFDVNFDVDLDLEIDGDIGTDIDSNATGLKGVTGFLLKWGLTGVPVTVVVSILVAYSWLVCYVIVSLVYPMITIDLIKLILGFVLLVLSFGLAIPITSWSIKPIKKLFITHDAVMKSSLIGSVCTVKTGTVTNRFGQATYDDGGAGMIFDVRAEEALGIKKGDSVILVEYNEEDGSYKIKKTV
ncbi:MAG: hypothetical protein AB8B80_02250 [Marinicellaceae bacterium]